MKRLLGGVMMAVGALIAGASGLCSASVLLVALGNMTLASIAWSNFFGFVAMILVIGGVPFAIGVGLIFGGRALVASSYTGDEPDDAAAD